MRTTSSYLRSWPGRRLPEVALETPEPAMRRSCATVPPAARSAAQVAGALSTTFHVDRRRWPRSSPARALVRSWAPGQQVHGESPRLVGWVDYAIEHVFGRRERCRR